MQSPEAHAPGAWRTLRRRVWEIVEVAKPGDRASRLFDISILLLILINVIVAVLGTVPAIARALGMWLDWFELVSVIVFSAEYGARVWSCVESDEVQTALWGRVAFALRPMLLVDLAAVLPFYLPFFGVDLRSLRALRLLRVLRVAKIGRYYPALRDIRRVVESKREELVITTVLMFLLLVFSSSVLFYAENDAQPEAFSSIPATMWWAIATLTTVGYGDIYPVTAVGKLLASVIAVAGVGMFALPTAILGAGFVEELGKRRQPPSVCPHCGLPLTGLGAEAATRGTKAHSTSPDHEP